MHRVRHSTVVVAVCVAAAIAARAQTCAPLDERAQARLISYVANKHSLPPELTVRIEDEGPVGDSCYRKIRFYSGGGPKFFQLDALLAPDRTFLLTGLEDTRIDPAVERRKQAAERAAHMTGGRAPAIGPANALVKVVVFSDFECPYCKNAAPVLEQLANSGARDIRVEFRQYPLNFHPWAFDAAVHGQCAASQSTEDFWKLHDYFFAHQSEITADSLDAGARKALSTRSGFDLAQYTICLSNEETKRAVRADIDTGNAVGVDGTPSIYVNGRKFGVLVTLEALRDFIDIARREQPAGTLHSQSH
jgi:protein-disulfide isomerase